jgi:hypothetical protein
VGRMSLECSRPLTITMRPEADDRLRAMSKAHRVPMRALVRQLVEDALIDCGELDRAEVESWVHRSVV